MATKPINKTASKKAAKSKPTTKSSSPAKSTKAVSKPLKKTITSKPAIKSAPSKSKSKISSAKTKVVAAKLPAKENTPKGNLKTSKTAVKTNAPVKPASKPAAKVIESNHIKTEVKSIHIMPTVAPKINLENKKQVNKSPNKSTTPPSTVTNGKTRYSDVELAEFKKVLDDKLLVARQELNYLQEQIVEMNENNADIQGSDWFDDSSIHAEVELLNNMA
ncbi:MAG: hypothetical protein ABI761_15915, partial [Saprospiraceae bacterium]